MGARTKYRKRALDILFESELQNLSIGATLESRLAVNDPPVNPYTATLVRGVIQNRERVDQLLAENSRGWTIARMPGVDRNLLRIAVYELLFMPEVPHAVAVSEAVELAADLSTDESPTFISGLLSAIVQSLEKA